MKILVLSDSHGHMQKMLDAVQKEQPDLIFHAGDCIRAVDRLADCCPDIPVIRVAGNCDRLSFEQEIMIKEYRGIRFYLTHGHLHGVKTGLMRLLYAAIEAEAKVVIFGHTHRPLCTECDGLLLLNPGSSCETYGVIEIKNGDPVCRISQVE